MAVQQITSAQVSGGSGSGAATAVYQVTSGTNAGTVTVSSIPFCVGQITVEIDGSYQSGTICVANSSTKNNSTSTRRSGVIAVTATEQVFFEADRTAFSTTCDITIRMRRIGFSSFSGNDISIGSINSNPEFPNSTVVRVFCVEDKT
jgi:hypothetical protein